VGIPHSTSTGRTSALKAFFLAGVLQQYILCRNKFNVLGAFDETWETCLFHDSLGSTITPNRWHTLKKMIVEIVRLVNVYLIYIKTHFDGFSCICHLEHQDKSNLGLSVKLCNQLWKLLGNKLLWITKLAVHLLFIDDFSGRVPWKTIVSPNFAFCHIHQWQTLNITW